MKVDPIRFQTTKRPIYYTTSLLAGAFLPVRAGVTLRGCRTSLPKRVTYTLLYPHKNGWQ
jgi:hypothetical protein